MAIFRVEKTKDYTVMANHHLRNRTLSLKSKGLLSQMLSLPENWDFTLKGLAVINRESIDSIREAVRELEQAGYIARTRERNDKGHLKGTDYTIFERPQNELQSQDPSNDEFPRSHEAAETESPSLSYPPQSKNPAKPYAQSMALPERGIPEKTSPELQSPAKLNHVHETATWENPTLETTILDNPTLGNPTLEKPTQENPTLDYPTQVSPTLENPTQLSTYPSSTEPSMTKRENTNPSNPYPIHPPRALFDPNLNDGWDGSGCDDPSALRRTIHRNIEYDSIYRQLHHEQLDEIVDIIVETLCSRKTIITVAGDEYPVSLVKDKLLRLNSAHIEYVLECLSQSTTFIRNIRKYILAALFNAPSTIDSYYSAMVRHDQSRDVGLR